jgi:amidohydrolase
VRNIDSKIKDIREQIHQYPELGNKEFQTSALIEAYLKTLGVLVQKVAGTGLVVFLDNKKKDTILLRADMDALPINENTGLKFSSKVPGVMHACGHDVHVAMLLGAIKKLLECRHLLNYNIKFAFQPNEEGSGGAQRMIDEGILINPPVSAAFALHVWPEFETGVVGIKSGSLTATCDEYTIEVIGKGGHVARPESNHNPIVATAELIMLIKALEITKPHIIEITSIHAGSGALNIVPENCSIQGSVRVVSPEFRHILSDKIKEVCKNIENKYDVECKFTPHYMLQFSPMINDDNLAQYAKQMISKHAIVNELEKPYFIAEDFACFSAHIPSLLLLLGCSTKERLGNNELHQSNMVVDEQAIDLGIEIFTGIVLSLNLE